MNPVEALTACAGQLERHEHAAGPEHRQARGVAVDGHGDAGPRRAVRPARLHLGLPGQAAGGLAARRLRPEIRRGLRPLDRHLAHGPARSWPARGRPPTGRSPSAAPTPHLPAPTGAGGSRSRRGPTPCGSRTRTSMRTARKIWRSRASIRGREGSADDDRRFARAAGGDPGPAGALPAGDGLPDRPRLPGTGGASATCYLLRLDGRVAGYGFVMGYQGRAEGHGHASSTSCPPTAAGAADVPPARRGQPGQEDRGPVQRRPPHAHAVRLRRARSSPANGRLPRRH